MAKKRNRNDQITNPEIPAAATILKGSRKNNRCKGEEADAVEGLNDSTQSAIW